MVKTLMERLLQRPRGIIEREDIDADVKIVVGAIEGEI